MMDYAWRLVYETEGYGGLAERGYFGREEQEAELRYQQEVYEAQKDASVKEGK